MSLYLDVELIFAPRREPSRRFRQGLRGFRVHPLIALSDNDFGGFLTESIYSSWKLPAGQPQPRADGHWNLLGGWRSRARSVGRVTELDPGLASLIDQLVDTISSGG
jgi:hypothetical protein